jgi:hypothetical protein
MPTVTILKSSRTFVYDDYIKGKATLRIKELNSVNPSQAVHRMSTSPVVAYLVTPDFYETRLAIVAPAPTINLSQKADDYLGYNLSKMVDLIQGHAQTKELMRETVDEGYGIVTGYKTYQLVNTKEYYEDGSDIVPFDSKRGGVVVAYLIHPDLYATLAAIVVP